MVFEKFNNFPFSLYIYKWVGPDPTISVSLKWVQPILVFSVRRELIHVLHATRDKMQERRNKEAYLGWMGVLLVDGPIGGSQWSY
jgi:hypothetical protein